MNVQQTPSNPITRPLILVSRKTKHMNLVSSIILNSIYCRDIKYLASTIAASTTTLSRPRLPFPVVGFRYISTCRAPLYVVSLPDTKVFCFEDIIPLTSSALIISVIAIDIAILAIAHLYRIPSATPCQYHSKLKKSRIKVSHQLFS